MTQKDLGDLLGISASTIGMYEQNRREPDIDMLLKISTHFDVSIDYLLCKTNIVKSNEAIKDENTITIAGRDGTYKQKKLTDEQIKMLQAMIDTLPEAPKDI